MSVNRELFLAVQGLTGNGLIDSAMVLLAEYLIVLVPLSLIYLWFRDTEDSIFSFYTAILGVAFSYALGLLYSHQNPSTVFDTLAAAKPDENAFPSQHTATIIAASLPMIYRKRRKVGSLLLISGLITGFARVYIGEHWPLDIAGSIAAALLALTAAALSWDLLEPVWRPLLDFAEKVEEEVFDRLPLDSPRNYI
jgi:undecaprenyl-diphosphatase